MIDVGMVLDLRNPPQWQQPWERLYGWALELCAEADRLGIGGIWMSEHHGFEDGYLPQPLTFAAAVAARTRACRVGTCIMQPALRIPAQLAEEAAVVDIISGGRLELGVGAGYRQPEFSLFGVDARKRYRLTEECITEVRRLWAERKVTPCPVQQEIPLWGGFYGPRGARLAGRLGMGLLYLSRTRFDDYLTGRRDAGLDQDGARVSGLLPVILADDPEEAWPQLARHAAYQHDSYKRYEVEGTGLPEPEPVDPERLRVRCADGTGPLLHVCTPERAAEYIRGRARGLPVKHVMLWATVAAMPDHLAHRHVELACTELRQLVA